MGHTMGHADEVYFVADSESLVSFFFFFFRGQAGCNFRRPKGENHMNGPSKTDRIRIRIGLLGTCLAPEKKAVLD